MDIITLRASSFPELFDCPARWEAKYVKGLKLPKSPAAQLGTAVHASTAVFDACALDGNPVTADEAAGAAVDAIHHPEEEVVWDDDMRPQIAERIALNLHGRYCREFAPEQNYLGVEVTCERVEIEDVGLAFTGTTDRIYVKDDDAPDSIGGSLGIVDLKTGSTAVGADGVVKTSGHLAQLAVYELLASQALERELTAPAQVIGMQTGKTEKAQRVAKADIVSPSRVLIGTEEQPGLLNFASNVLHSGLFYGNPRSQLCSVKYCPAYGTCRFRG